MSIVLIRHKVANYAKWKKAVRACAPWRKKSGEKCFRAFRSASSPNDLTIICSFSTAAKMKAFIKSAELRKRMKDAGVVSKPQIQFFSASEDLSIG
jgi:hypothetical protein